MLYLCEHLLVNAQVAFDQGSGFVRMVNSIHEMPLLKGIEVVLLGVPFLIHACWGIAYVRTAKSNLHSAGGRTPGLPEYARNHAYSWQRITAWIVLFGVIAHVVHMRFVEYPKKTYVDGSAQISVRLHDDPALAPFVEKMHSSLVEREGERAVVATDSMGRAFLFILRDAFQSPLAIALYALFVLATIFHACNGVSTFCIRWGLTLTQRSQRAVYCGVVVLMGVLTILAGMAIVGSALL